MAAVSNGDIEAIREIYAADAVLEDPVGSELREGIEAICAFYQQGVEMGVTAELTGALCGEHCGFSLYSEGWGNDNRSG